MGEKELLGEEEEEEVGRERGANEGANEREFWSGSKGGPPPAIGMQSLVHVFFLSLFFFFTQFLSPNSRTWWSRSIVVTSWNRMPFFGKSGIARMDLAMISRRPASRDIFFSRSIKDRCDGWSVFHCCFERVGWLLLRVRFQRPKNKALAQRKDGESLRRVRETKEKRTRLQGENKRKLFFFRFRFSVLFFFFTTPPPKPNSIR